MKYWNEYELKIYYISREVCSETGASFEISEEQLRDKENIDWRENFFDDEELVKSLRLGAGNGIFEDEESGEE